MFGSSTHVIQLLYANFQRKLISCLRESVIANHLKIVTKCLFKGKKICRTRPRSYDDDIPIDSSPTKGDFLFSQNFIPRPHFKS